jgi:hypothetical protein
MTSAPLLSAGDPGEARPCFPVVPQLLEAVLRGVTPAKGFSTKTDAWTLLGLLRLAFTKAARKYRSRQADVTSVTFTFTRAELLEASGCVRSRGRGPYADFPGKDWQQLRESLKRWTGETLEFSYTRKGEDGELAERVQRRPLVELTGSEVTLHCFPGITCSYFVLVPERVFEFRPRLTPTALAVLLWLIRNHRGRKVRRTMVHKWRHVLDPDIIEADILHVAKGRRAEAFRRVAGAIAVLEKLGVVSVIEVNRRRIVVETSRDFFHVEQPGKAARRKRK